MVGVVSKKQSMPAVNKQDLYISDMPRICVSTGAAAKLQIEKNRLLSHGRYKQTFLGGQTRFTVLMAKECRLLELI